MPILPGDLPVLRSTPQTTKLYLVVQQPQTYSGGTWSGYFTSTVLTAAPTGDPVAELTVNGAWSDAVTIRDGMTIFIGSSAGKHDKGITRYRGDDLAVNGETALPIAPTSELHDAQIGDHVTVLDEFQLWNRYPRVVNTAGVLAWYKDYDVTYNSLGADAATRRQASMPAVPILGPHAVRFIDVGGDADVYFDWSDSYATAPGATVNGWASAGEDGGAGWSSAVQVPGFQTYSNVSGLAGYGVRLTVATDKQDPAARWRRGERYVFTLRKPGQTQGGDPSNAEPIINFDVSSIGGDYSSGRWRASIKVYGSDASEHVFAPGSLVILFAVDDYASQPAYMGTGPASVGPIYDREEIVFIGHIADDSITQNSETGEVSFEALSVAELASRRENYPVPIEYNDSAIEWYETPSLTLARAVWFYIVWHTTLAVISDFYTSSDLEIDIKASDFLAGSLYSTIDSFLDSRRFGRLLVDRFERCKVAVDVQALTYGGAPTLFTLADTDWISALSFREVNEKRVSYLELGGVKYNAGLIVPLISNAPGDMGGYGGTPSSSTHLAITSQSDLNQLAGRIYAARNNRWPQAGLSMAGNWRVGDIWPQEYVYITATTDRHTFTNARFILRDISYEYDRTAGALFVTYTLEMETEGVNGITVDIPAELPIVNPPPIPSFPPYIPPTPGNPEPRPSTRRMVVTDVGVFVTDDIEAEVPVWYGINTGLSSATDLDGYSIVKNPFHWQVGDKSLYIGTGTGIWKMDDFQTGEWEQLISLAAINTATGESYTALMYTRLNFNIEFENRFAFVIHYDGGFGDRQYRFIVVQDGVISNTYDPGTGTYTSYYADIKFAQHSAGQTIYATRPQINPFVSTELFKTIDGGSNWTSLVYATVVNSYDSLSIPYVDSDNVNDTFVLFGNRGVIEIGINDGYSTVSGTTGNNWTKMGTGGHPDYIWLLSQSPGAVACKWSSNRGVDWTELPLLAGGNHFFASNVKWSEGVLQEALVGSDDGTVWLWKQGYSSWEEKTGNLLGFFVTDIRGIERDTAV